MKSYELFIESTYNSSELIQILENSIIKNNKVINGFKFERDSRSGTFEWSDKYYYILATPYWDGSKELPVNICNFEGDDIDFQQFDLPELKNINDVNKTIEFYYKKIDKITSDLNKRTDLKNKLKLILTYSEIIINTSVKGEFIRNIYSIEQIDIDKIPQTDVIKLLNIIDKKYSHFTTANKFNI